MATQFTEKLSIMTRNGTSVDEVLRDRDGWLEGRPIEVDSLDESARKTLSAILQQDVGGMAFARIEYEGKLTAIYGEPAAVTREVNAVTKAKTPSQGAGISGPAPSPSAPDTDKKTGEEKQKALDEERKAKDANDKLKSAAQNTQMVNQSNLGALLSATGNVVRGAAAMSIGAASKVGGAISSPSRDTNVMGVGAVADHSANRLKASIEKASTELNAMGYSDTKDIETKNLIKTKFLESDSGKSAIADLQDNQKRFFEAAEKFKGVINKASGEDAAQMQSVAKNIDELRDAAEKSPLSDKLDMEKMRETAEAIKEMILKLFAALFPKKEGEQAPGPVTP